MKKKLLVALLGLVILGAVIYALTLIPKWALLTWAIFVTLALPTCVYGAWNLGHIESQGMVKGLDMGINKVSGAAGKMRPVPTPKTNIAVLPAPPPVYHRELAGSEGMVDL